METGEVKWTITACRVEKINKYFSFSVHPWYLLGLGRQEAPFQRNMNTSFIQTQEERRINRWGNLTKTESNNQMLWGAVIPLQTVIPSEIRQKLVLTQWLLLAITDTTYSGQYSSQQMTREKMILTGTLPENDIRYQIWSEACWLASHLGCCKIRSFFIFTSGAKAARAGMCGTIQW